MSEDGNHKKEILIFLSLILDLFEKYSGEPYRKSLKISLSFAK
jgi:hypothetical protein